MRIPSRGRRGRLRWRNHVPRRREGKRPDQARETLRVDDLEASQRPANSHLHRSVMRSSAPGRTACLQVDPERVSRGSRQERPLALGMRSRGRDVVTGIRARRPAYALPVRGSRVPQLDLVADRVYGRGNPGRRESHGLRPVFSWPARVPDGVPLAWAVLLLFHPTGEGPAIT
jgi:hypothetical protein